MYIYLLIIIIIILIINSIIKLNLYRREDKLEKRIIEKRKEKLEEEFSVLEGEMQKKTQKLNADFDVLSARVANARAEADESVRGYESMKEAQDRAGAEYVELLRKKNEEEIHRSFDQNVSEYRSDIYSTLTQIRQDAQEELGAYLSANQELVEQKKKEIEDLDTVIADFRAKREVINQEILRQRAIEEKLDFYRVCLTDNAKQEIEVLRSIAPRLSNRSFLDKIIYDTYIAKPTQEMIKRVLGGAAPSGIYKITRLKTGEIYVGKSTNIKDRWAQHVKTVFGVGTIAHSTLHTTMEKDGVDNFTFELLEEIPKEDLGIREKYWINFYGSKEYGMNEKAGG